MTQDRMPTSCSTRVAWSHPDRWCAPWKRSTSSVRRKTPGTPPARTLPALPGARTQRLLLANQVPARRHGGSPDPTSTALVQALLSFDQAPPLAAPLRFFLTAPLFAILAGLLLLWSGPDLFASRWTPAALALTHLITVGFMLQVMLGAMIQILPVVAGANMSRPLLVASLVHVAITLGAVAGSGFLSYEPLALRGGRVSCSAAAWRCSLVRRSRSLYGVPSTNPTIRGLKLALSG
jgi:hypothetical protein